MLVEFLMVDRGCRLAGNVSSRCRDVIWRAIIWHWDGVRPIKSLYVAGLAIIDLSVDRQLMRLFGATGSFQILVRDFHLQ